MADLFAPIDGCDGAAPLPPLADRLRPTVLSEVVGQAHLVGPDGALTRLIEGARRGRAFGSIVLWGPPGTGKTTVARLLAQETGLAFEQVSAIFAGVADLKKVFDAARLRRRSQGVGGYAADRPAGSGQGLGQGQGQGTLLFVDEIHRFNRAQQDAFLPVIEDGTVTLVGATTENPSFALNAALLSRARVLTFMALDAVVLDGLLTRAERALGEALPLTVTAREVLVRFADGDGRMVLALAEDVWRVARPGEMLDEARLGEVLQRRAPLYDKAADGHYNLVSALHKSVRGSDPDAALYYFARMVDAGEDPRFLARRLVRMAVEDIGLADPQALIHARAAAEAYEQLGSPEGELALANTVIYLATAPKSNAAYVAFKQAQACARASGSQRPPLAILNAPTGLMKAAGYGEGYLYDHDQPDAFSGQDYWPETLGRQRFYTPPDRGFEREIHKRLGWWARLRDMRHGKSG